tara:strand:+ start:902 stop:1267 length:366 start_codon:yes stop_codon:yes gene_type:complete
MSVGNLKDYGNKGNNFPYQLQNLQALGLILEALGSSNTGLTAKEAEVAVKNGPGSLPVKAYTFSVYNSGAAAGTFNAGSGSISLPAGVTLNYDAGGLTNFFAANTFAWDATGTTFIITYTF